ncbi:MAG TPA: thiamine-phosphate kinase [Acidobacteriota bacterium]|nr:thiamine-phosphate kinase [Acidobacteriota bacterium]
MSDIRKLGEQGIIDLFRSDLTGNLIVKSIGDDCAVIKQPDGKLLLWTTDMLVEGVHFERGFGSPYDLGYKSLAVNLSDIAAMGGEPVACLLCLSLPRTLPEQWICNFRNGFTDICEKYGCPLIGGDTCGSNGSITISVTVMGTVPESQVLLRDAANEGDDIWISAVPGVSALGLKILSDKSDSSSAVAEAAVGRHLRPEPCLSLGRKLAAERLANACIDTSDGLVIDLGHVGEASKLGAMIYEKWIPLPEMPADQDDDPFRLALHGGEDYGLLFTSHPDNRAALETAGGLFRIGNMVTALERIQLVRSDGTVEHLIPAGFSHF